MWNVTVKGLLAHKLRLALTAVAIVLGVSFMAGTFVLTDTINHTFNVLFAQTAQGKDVVVRAKVPATTKTTGADAANVVRAPVPDSLVSTVRNVSGVKLADGDIQGYAQLVGKNGKVVASGGAPTFGTNWSPDRQLSSFTIRQGRGPANADEIAIDNATFKSKKFHLGDRVTVLTAQAPRQFTIVGALGFGSADNLAGATFVVFDGPTAQQLMGTPGQWDQIEVAAKPGVSATSLAAAIATALPAGYEAVTAQSVAANLAKSIEANIGQITTFLLVFALVALFVGAFIIYNTFSILVTQRSRELALLRALGASRRQVNRSVVTEAAVVGVFASAVGLGAGVLLALGLEALFRAIGFGLPTSSLQLLPRTIIVALVAGTLVTLFSAIIPARRAARVPPVAAMGDSVVIELSSLRKRNVAGALLGVAGMILLSTGLFGHISNTLTVVGIGAALIFVGVAMLSPLVATPLAHLLGSPLAATRGVTGKLGQQNAMRNPRRTASTAAALMVGVALVTVIATLGATLSATFSKIIDNSVKADFVVSASGFGTGLSPQLAKNLAGLPQLSAVSAGRQGRWQAGTTTHELVAVDPVTGPKVINFEMKSGSVSALAKGEVLVDTSKHLTVGDRLDMTFDATGIQHLTVGGTFAPNEFTGSYVVSLAVFDANYPKPLDDLVFIKSGTDPATALKAIQGVTKAYPNATVQDQTAFKAQNKARVSMLLNIVYVLLAFSILIALIGIVNTLALSVIERTRELGLLRAVGMKRRQVRRMIRGEAVIVCLIGALLGVAVGLGLGLAIVAAIKLNGAKIVQIPVTTLVVVLIFAAVAGVIAAIFPARRAARLDVLKAIATT
jgi:putative ABC transport system permease protein